MQGFYKFPIEYEIRKLPNPQDILRNFEDSGYTFNVKESKEYLFKYEVKDEGIFMPVKLTKDQLEKSKDRPYLIPEAYIVELFSDYKEDDSDI